MKRILFLILALLICLPLAAAPAAAQSGSTPEEIHLDDLVGLDETMRFTVEQVFALLQEAYDRGYEDGKTASPPFAFVYATQQAAASSRRANASAPSLKLRPEITYVLNKNTMKFHYPYCDSVDDMSEKNRWDFDGTREEVIAMGYAPCKRCNP